MPSRRDVDGVDQEVGGEAVGGEELERPLEAPEVVDEGPGDGELVEDHAVDVEGGVVDAGADHHEDAAPPQLVEARLDGGPVSRALQDDVHRPRRHALGLPGREHLQIGRVDHGAGPERRPPVDGGLRAARPR